MPWRHGTVVCRELANQKSEKRYCACSVLERSKTGKDRFSLFWKLQELSVVWSCDVPYDQLSMIMIPQVVSVVMCPLHAMVPQVVSVVWSCDVSCDQLSMHMRISHDHDTTGGECGVG